MWEWSSEGNVINRVVSIVSLLFPWEVDCWENSVSMGSCLWNSSGGEGELCLRARAANETV